MNTAARLAGLAARKQRLIARSEAQRAAIAASFQRLKAPIGVAERVLEAGRYLRAHPLLFGALAAALVVLKRRTVLRMAARGFALWRAWRLLAAWTAKLSTRAATRES